MRERSLFALLLPGIVAVGGCASPVPPRLAWTAASEVQTISPSGATTLRAGDEDVPVEAGGSLWIDALPGERVRVTGAARSEELEVGIAARDADPGEAITWLAGAAIPGGVTLLVPHWSPSSTVVVRARAAARLRVAVAEPEVELLGWERFEEDAVEWARGARAAPPPAPSEAMAPSLRYLSAMRDAMGARAGSAAGRAWLSLALVQEGLLRRPLTSLVFPWAPVAVTGGREIVQNTGPLEPTERTVRRAVGAGGSLAIAAPEADVVRLEIAGGAGPSRVVLSAAGSPVRTLQLAGGGRRSAPVRVRLLVPASGALQAKVEAGEVTIGVAAYRHRSSLAERFFLHRRDASALAEAAAADVADAADVVPGKRAADAVPVNRAADAVPGKRAVDALPAKHAVEAVPGTLAAAARARDAASFRALSAAAASAGEPGVEAVLLTLATTIAPSGALAVGAARGAFQAAEKLRAATAWPLRRRVVEALLDRRPEIAAATPEGLGLRVPASSEGADEDDRVAVRVALAILDPGAGPVRPEAADLATRFALRDTSRDDWASRARLAWQTEVGWRPLPVVGAPEVRVTWSAPVVEPGAPGALCETTAGGVPRWTRLVPGVRSLPIAVPAGATHAVVPIRGETLQGFAPGALRIDATAVPVHGAIGVASVVGVAAGAHTWTLAEGAPPVLVRVPREGSAPCGELRRMDRWFLATGEVSVDVPPGGVETVARVTVRRVGEGKVSPLRLDVGGAHAELRAEGGGELRAGARAEGGGELRAGARAEGGGELRAEARAHTTNESREIGEDGTAVLVPIRVTGGAVRITPSAPVWLRVEVRARAEKGAAVLLALPTAPDEATSLAVVRAATKAITAASDDAGRASALRERASALVSLGFRRLAAIDVGRANAKPVGADGVPAGADGVPAGGDGKVPGGDGVPAGGDGKVPGGDGVPAGGDGGPPDDVLARVLPAGSPAVVPLDVAASIEELPAPAGSSALASIIERFAGGDAAGAAMLFAGVAEPARPDESTLLRALVAERARAPEPAARAYERLATEADRPAAFARAALAYADLSISKGDPALALTGYLLAKRGQLRGVDARAALARLDPAVGFARPDTAGAAGHAWVERNGQDPKVATSLAERVRRAYLDAPDDATILDDDERLVLRVAPAKAARLVVEHACTPLEAGSLAGATSSPAPSALPAGAPSSLVPSALAAGVGGGPGPRVASSCRVEVRIDNRSVACAGLDRGCWAGVPKGKHRVEIALTGTGERMGWARLRWDEAEPLRPRSASRWFETDAARPLAMSFAGPTLVRVAARGTPGLSDRLDVRVDGASAAALALDAAADPAAFRRDLEDDADRALRAPQEIEVVVMQGGPHTLEVRSGGRALVLPSFAIARGLPRPSSLPDVAPGPLAVGAPIAPMPAPAPLVGEDAPPGPLTLSARASLVLDRATDPAVPEDDAGRYVEASITARRRFLDGLLFTRLGALARVRTGLPTFGADARVDFGPPVGSPIPRVFLEGTLFGQQGGAAFGQQGGPAGQQGGPVGQQGGPAVGQQLGSAVDVAGWLHTGVWWQVEPLPAVSFVPTIGVDLSTVQLASVARHKDLGRLDPDVYARYDAPRPVELFATLLGSYRATMDSIVRLRLGAHMDGFAGVDDVFAYPSIDVSPGRGITPSLSLGYAVSYHFASASISEPYVRHRVDLTAFFWQWVRASHRVSVSASALLQAGSPFDDEADLKLIFSLGYDFTAGRGVSDYSPLEMQFREREDEGGGRVIRRAPRTGEPPPEPAAAP